MASVLHNYTFHPLSDLGSLNRQPTRGPCRVSIDLPSETSLPLLDEAGGIRQDGLAKLRAAFTSTLMQYLDTQDILLAETDPDYLHDPEAVWLRLMRATSHPELSWSQYAHHL